MVELGVVGSPARRILSKFIKLVIQFVYMVNSRKGWSSISNFANSHTGAWNLSVNSSPASLPAERRAAHEAFHVSAAPVDSNARTT